MDFYYVFGGYQKYNYSYVRDDDVECPNATIFSFFGFSVAGTSLPSAPRNTGSPVIEGKIYYSPFFSSSALASLTDYANTETVGKSDYLKLSDGVIALPCSARISGEEL